eukprot:6478464-Prorocentrum_lima.AAC.1
MTSSLVGSEMCIRDRPQVNLWTSLFPQGRKAHQDLQARALIESISTQVRQQQRAQESHLRTLHDQLHAEQ